MEEQFIFGEVRKIARIKIRPFADQPRTYFDQAALQGLADSIKQVGQKNPVTIKTIEPDQNGCTYELIDGQRRWHACEIAGKTEILAWITEVENTNEQFIASVVSNFGREGHTVLEVARAIKKIRDMGKTTEDIQRMFGKSITWVYQHLKILALPDEVLNLMGPEIEEAKRLKFSTALLLTDIPPAHQISLALTISQMDLSMSQARHMIKKTVQTEGLKRSKNRPGREFDSLFGFARRTDEELEVILDTSLDQLRRILSGGKLQERMKLLELLEESLENLSALKETIERIEKEGVKNP